MRIIPALPVRGGDKETMEIQQASSLTPPASPFSIALFCPGLELLQEVLEGENGSTWSG
jgi:hypothetical protein